MRRSCMLAALIASAIALSSDSAGACRCFHVPVCGAGIPDLRDADVVFIGSVTEVTPAAARFRVERVFSGNKEVAAYDVIGSGSNCDLGFKQNERYLVYAWQDGKTGRLATSMCSRTRPATDAQAIADVAYFDARDAGRSLDGWLSGVVQERHYDSSRRPDGQVRGQVLRPLSGIPVTVTSAAGEKRSTVTDEHGVYVFPGLRPPYDPPLMVKAELPRLFVPHDGAVEMRGNMAQPGVLWFRTASCAEADIDARVDGRIAGRVLDERGNAARGVTMELASIGRDPWAGADETTVSDEQGRFEFRPLPEGQYYLGVELGARGTEGSLDRRRFYPGVRDQAQAAVIRLGRGERLRLETFRLPALPTERTITFVLRGPSPEVVARARVSITGATKEPLSLVSGSAAVRLPFGATYQVSVEPPTGYVASFEPPEHASQRARLSQIRSDDTDRTIAITLRPRP